MELLKGKENEEKSKSLDVAEAARRSGMTEATGLPVAANEEKPKPKPGG